MLNSCLKVKKKKKKKKKERKEKKRNENNLQKLSFLGTETHFSLEIWLIIGLFMTKKKRKRKKKERKRKRKERKEMKITPCLKVRKYTKLGFSGK